MEVHVRCTITGDHSKQDQILLVKKAEYIGFCVYRRSYLIWSRVLVQRIWGQITWKVKWFCPKNGTAVGIERSYNPFRTAVPFWGQTSQILSTFSPERDCGPKRVTAFSYMEHRFWFLEIEVSAPSQPCLNRETGESGPLFLKSKQRVCERHATPFAASSG